MIDGKSAIEKIQSGNFDRCYYSGYVMNISSLDENKMYYEREEIQEVLDSLDWEKPNFIINNNPQKDPLLFRIHLLLNPYAVRGYHDGSPSGETVLATPRYTQFDHYVRDLTLTRGMQYDMPHGPNRRIYSLLSVFKASENNKFTDDTGITDGAPYKKLKDIKGDSFDKECFETALIPGENPRVGFYLVRGFTSPSFGEMEITPITYGSKIYEILKTNQLKNPNFGGFDVSYKFEPNWEKLDFANNAQITKDKVAEFMVRQEEKKAEVKLAAENAAKKAANKGASTLTAAVKAAKSK